MMPPGEAAQAFFDELDRLATVAPLRPVSAFDAPQEPGALYRFWRDDWGMTVDGAPHVEMANDFEAALGDCSFSGDMPIRLMRGYPRGTFKTTGFSEATPVYVLTRNPNAKILLDGFRHNVAKARLRAIRRKIENDPTLDAHYQTQAWRPAFRSDTWNDEEIIITPRTDLMSREASIATAGVDVSMNAQHFDLIIADDVVTDTNVRTVEGRERVYQHILDLLPILNPGGVLLIVFTTWHVDDAYARLIKLEAERERRGQGRIFDIRMRGAYDGPTGLFFPQRLTHAFLDEQRETMGERKFAAQYLLKPIADEDKTFSMDAAKLRAFTFYTTPERRFGGIVRLDTQRNVQLDVETTLAWDPAGRKPSRTTDSHGLTVVGTDSLDIWWILEAFSRKGLPSQILDLVCRLIVTYRPWTVSVEDVAAQGLWLDMLADECGRRGIATSFTEFSTGGVPKNERIVLLQPRWPSKMMMRADADGRPVHTALWAQMDAFSPGTALDHEDVLDSLVQHLRLTRKPEPRAIRSVENPPDPEYAAFRQRQVAAGVAGSMAGLFGPVWTP
ncbi:MAG: hypothetical protein KGL39_09025 [Patescibacteria group bacterium]|nr:hypothetical protein [Patescibacteria group bacterium]